MTIPKQIIFSKPYNVLDEFETVVEATETEIITKKVLYKKDGTVVEDKTRRVIVNVANKVAELAKVEASAKAEREALVATATAKNISLNPVQ